MNPNYMSLNNAIARVVKSPVDQGRIVAVAVALAVSASATLPSSEVEDKASYFMGSVVATVRDQISELNEGVVFNAKQALEYAERFWMMRYTAAHPMTLIDGGLRPMLNPLSQESGKVGNFDFMTCYMGGPRVLSTDLNAFINQYKVELLELVGEVMNAMTCEAA